MRLSLTQQKDEDGRKENRLKLHRKRDAEQRRCGIAVVLHGVIDAHHDEADINHVALSPFRAVQKDVGKKQHDGVRAYGQPFLGGHAIDDERDVGGRDKIEQAGEQLDARQRRETGR